MRKAVIDRDVSRELLQNTPDPLTLLPEPPQPWVVTGPRGGRYVAVPPFRLLLSEDVGDYFIRNRVLARWESSGVQYVRPRSRLARELDSQPLTG